MREEQNHDSGILEPGDGNKILLAFPPLQKEKKTKKWYKNYKNEKSISTEVLTTWGNPCDKQNRVSPCVDEISIKEKVKIPSQIANCGTRQIITFAFFTTGNYSIFPLSECLAQLGLGAAMQRV